ncbi:MAG: hypothetical protein AAFP86_11835, partial [Planctomycetota bacterium]
IGKYAALALAGAVIAGCTVGYRVGEVDPGSLQPQPVDPRNAVLDAAGTPVAATDVGDIAASLPPSARRFVVPLGPSVESGLGQAYARLAAEGALRGALAAEGREHVVERFSVDAMVARYLEIYGAALHR